MCLYLSGTRAGFKILMNNKNNTAEHRKCPVTYEITLFNPAKVADYSPNSDWNSLIFFLFTFRNGSELLLAVKELVILQEAVKIFSWFRFSQPCVGIKAAPLSRSCNFSHNTTTFPKPTTQIRKLAISRKSSSNLYQRKIHHSCSSIVLALAFAISTRDPSSSSHCDQCWHTSPTLSL